MNQSKQIKSKINSISTYLYEKDYILKWDEMNERQSYLFYDFL